MYHRNPHQPQLHFAIHQSHINRNLAFDVFLTRWELTLSLPLGLTGGLQQLNLRHAQRLPHPLNTECPNGVRAHPPQPQQDASLPIILPRPELL